MSSPLYRRPHPQWRSPMRISNWLRPLAARLNRTSGADALRLAGRRPPQRPPFRPRVEGLEDRVVPAAVNQFTEFAVPTEASTPNLIAPGPDGNLWFSEYSVITST